jgi:molybdate transport system substrate-binding protein
MAIKVLSTLALKGVLEKLPQVFARAGALELTFDATQAILPRVRAGESADLLILTAEAMDALQREGLVSRTFPLGGSGVGVAVRAGAPRPDISSVDALKASLLAASSVAHSRVGASGIYFAGVLERLGIAERLKKRVVVEKGPVGLVVARGEAEIGIQQLCELEPVAGIDIVGPLPEGLQKITYFSAGLHARAAEAAGALRLAELLGGPEARAAMLAGGLSRSEGG